MTSRPRAGRGRRATIAASTVLFLVGTLGFGATAAPRRAAADAAPSTTATPVFSARRVPALVQAIAAGPELKAELLSVVDASPDDTCLAVDVGGHELFRADAEAPLVPASNQKIVTAQLALDVLGSDHRFSTQVGGALDGDGVVDGDLYLIGGGDPVLRTKAYADYFGALAGAGTSLEDLADAVVAKGVKHVTGSVIGDESRYDAERSVPGWPDRYLDQHQLGPLSALEVNQSFTSFPDTYDEENLGALVAAADPPEFAARTFADLLEARGVRIDGRAGAGVRPRGTALIASATSPPLSAIVHEMLNRSDNQIAELLVKEAGVVEAGAGTTAAGLAVFQAAFDRLGLPARGVVMHDGSGLGYDNRLTCDLLAALLDRTGTDSAIGSGLAVGGRTGTLRERFTDPATRGHIRAKTGTLNDVSSLSGFAQATAAPPLVFSYIANGAAVTPALLEVQERLGVALVDYADGVPLAEVSPRR